MPGLLLVLATLGCACGGGGGGSTVPSDPAPFDPDSLEIPRPDLASFEPSIQARVEALQERVESARTADGAANALGELGIFYHAVLFLEAAERCYAQAAELAPDQPRWHYYLGVTQGHQGKDREAKGTFERALELAPEDLAIRIRLGDLHLKLGQAKEARRSFLRATEIAPRSAAAWFGLGRAAVLAGDDRAAIRHFERTLELAPDATAVHYPLAQAYRRQGDTERAEEHLAQRGAQGLGFPDPRMQKVLQQEVDTAIDTLRSLAAQPERLSVEELVQIAQGQIGKKGGAVERFRHRVESEGPGVEEPAHQARLYLVLGQMLQAHGSPEAAARHLDRALRLDPSLATGELRLRLAQALLAQGDRAGAEVELRRAVQREDLPTADRAVAWHRLGELARQRDAGSEAVERYRRALGLDPDLLDARLGLATALGRLGRFDEAATEYRRVQAAAPQVEDAWLGEATALTLSHRPGAARDRLEAGLRAVPESRTLARTLAQILASSPDPEVRDGARAVELARRVMEAEPTAASAETLAMALAQAGRFAEAVRIQEELLRQMGASGGAAQGARLRANLQRYRDRQTCCARP